MLPQRACQCGIPWAAKPRSRLRLREYSGRVRPGGTTDCKKLPTSGYQAVEIAMDSCPFRGVRRYQRVPQKGEYFNSLLRKRKRRTQVLMLKGRGHAADLGLRKTQSSSLFTPSCHCPPDFGGDHVRLAFIQFKIPHHTHRQVQRGRSVIEINGRCQNTRLSPQRIEGSGYALLPLIRSGHG